MLQVGALRMRRHEYELAARDFAHVLEMSRCLYGPRSSLLIPLAERLCKAHVLLRRWREARDALELAHELAISKHGPEHAEVRRIEAVLSSLDKYAPPRTSVGVGGGAAAAGGAGSRRRGGAAGAADAAVAALLLDAAPRGTSAAEV